MGEAKGKQWKAPPASLAPTLALPCPSHAFPLLFLCILFASYLPFIFFLFMYCQGNIQVYWLYWLALVGRLHYTEIYTMQIKNLVYPGYVPGTDAFVSGSDLIRLWGLNPAATRVIRHPNDEYGYCMEEYDHYFPRSDGDYTRKDS